MAILTACGGGQDTVSTTTENKQTVEDINSASDLLVSESVIFTPVESYNFSIDAGPEYSNGHVFLCHQDEAQDSPETKNINFSNCVKKARLDDNGQFTDDVEIINTSETIVVAVISESDSSQTIYEEFSEPFELTLKK